MKYLRRNRHAERPMTSPRNIWRNVEKCSPSILTIKSCESRKAVVRCTEMRLVAVGGAGFVFLWEKISLPFCAPESGASRASSDLNIWAFDWLFYGRRHPSSLPSVVQVGVLQMSTNTWSSIIRWTERPLLRITSFFAMLRAASSQFQKERWYTINHFHEDWSLKKREKAFLVTCWPSENFLQFIIMYRCNWPCTFCRTPHETSFKSE